VTELHRPDSLAAALELLHGGDARPLAGGTALMLPERRRGLPGALVALDRVDELNGVSGDRSGVRIGALSTHAQLASSPLLRAACPALAQTFGRVATLRVRNQATVGGNLALADPAHDPPAILIALDARVLVASRDSRREVAVAELASGPFASTLAPDELIVEVRIPPLDGLVVAHRKFIARTASFRDEAGYPTVSCGVALALDDNGACTRARVGISGAHRVPARVRVTEELLENEPITPELARTAARAASAELDPVADERGSAEYKREMAAVWIARAVLRAVR
jgi:carbon-monoxide dehydrogenase medium subunit